MRCSDHQVMRRHFFCSLTQRNWLGYVSIIGTAVCLAAVSTYEFATGGILIYSYTSFEMAIFE